jgi:hypothetical protein
MSEGGLRPGDQVEVLSAEEILATLDAGGSLAGLPFMSEMLRHCGRRFVVSKRADKVCDTIHYSGSRRVPEAVFLEDLRCDGGGHGGCQAECRLYWKERWLKRVDPAAPTAQDPGERASPQPVGRLGAPVSVAEDQSPAGYQCQATELLRASHALRTFDPRPYLDEVASGNVTIGRFLRVMARAAWMQPLEKLRLLPKIHVKGSRPPQAPPEPALGLAPGEWVRVKTKAQIAATLNEKGRNRGLWFDREMLPYCGKVFRVRKRVQRIIDEGSGRLLELKNDCIMLEGAVCTGENSTGRWLCTRGIYSYWRECWLERVGPPDQPRAGSPAPGEG